MYLETLIVFHMNNLVVLNVLDGKKSDKNCILHFSSLTTLVYTKSLIICNIPKIILIIFFYILIGKNHRVNTHITNNVYSEGF